MSKMTPLLIIIAFVALTQGKGIFKNLGNHIKDKIEEAHDKAKEAHDKMVDKIEEIHNKHHPTKPEPPTTDDTPDLFPKEPEEWEGPRLKAKPSVFFFNFDDAITQLYINNNKVPFQFSEQEAKTWENTKKMKMIIYPGDILKVVGKNTNGIAGVAGTLHFFNKKGKEKIFNTGKGWFCNGKPAVLKGPNDGSVKEWPYMPLVEKEAQWIWVEDNAINKEVTCVFQVPCK